MARVSPSTCPCCAGPIYKHVDEDGSEVWLHRDTRDRMCPGGNFAEPPMPEPETARGVDESKMAEEFAYWISKATVAESALVAERERAEAAEAALDRLRVEILAFRDELIEDGSVAAVPSVANVCQGVAARLRRIAGSGVSVAATETEKP